MDVDAVCHGQFRCDLWNHDVNESYTLQASDSWLCSAFIIVNVDRAIVNFWELLYQKIESGGDQASLVLLREVFKVNPGIMRPRLPLEWDTLPWDMDRKGPFRVLERRPDGVGMHHFHGNRPNYFQWQRI
jgi:hypothetical protein